MTAMCVVAHTPQLTGGDCGEDCVRLHTRHALQMNRASSGHARAVTTGVRLTRRPWGLPSSSPTRKSLPTPGPA